MMREYLNEDVNKIIIDESLLTGMSWGGNQWQDFILVIDWSGQEDLKDEIDFMNINSTLYFEFVTEFASNIKFKRDTMGALEITTFNFRRIDRFWFIEFIFKFYGVGHLRFMCKDFKFIIEDKPV